MSLLLHGSAFFVPSIFASFSLPDESALIRPTGSGCSSEDLEIVLNCLSSTSLEIDSHIGCPGFVEKNWYFEIVEHITAMALLKFGSLIA